MKTIANTLANVITNEMPGVDAVIVGLESYTIQAWTVDGHQVRQGSFDIELKDEVSGEVVDGFHFGVEITGPLTLIQWQDFSHNTTIGTTLEQAKDNFSNMLLEGRETNDIGQAIANLQKLSETITWEAPELV
jgi:hypothetical protein